MTNEQTWPTEEEMSGAVTHFESVIDGVPDASKGTTPKRIKRIPRGMSEYQASWIVDESDESEDNTTDQRSAVGEQDEEMVPLASADDIDNDRSSAVAFHDLDVEEEERQCVSRHISLVLKPGNGSNTDSKSGAIVRRRNVTHNNFPMRSILPRTFLQVHGSPVTVACVLSARALGILMKTYPKTMPESSTSKTSNARNGMCKKLLKLKVSRYPLSLQSCY